MGSCFRGVIAYVGGLPWADPSSQLGAALGESPPTIVGYRHFLYSMRCTTHELLIHYATLL